VITPRRTRLLRAHDLRAFHRAIAETACPPDVARCRSCTVIVPTTAAAAELRVTLENLLMLGASGAGEASGALGAINPHRRAIALPDLVTRDEWYRRMHERLPSAPPLLSRLEREVLADAAARDAVDSGFAPPFRLRPGLVAEILDFHDDLHRHRRTIDAFERLLVDELEPRAESDRGAARLLAQTRFLIATWRAYQRRRSASGGVDEHALRELLLQAAGRATDAHIVVTVGERAFDPAGLYAADYDLLTRIDGVETIDVIATEELLDAGMGERLRDMLPGVEELAAPPDPMDGTRAAPAVFVSRDREDELADVARAVRASVRADAGRCLLDRKAVVFRRPLPYVYLAQTIFDAADIPFQAVDALPLASEPYAAALDLVFSFVAASFTRSSTVALLSSPHLQFDGGGGPVDRLAISALDRALADNGYLGGGDELARVADRITGPAASAARAAAAAASELAPLTGRASASTHLDALVEFLRRHDRPRAPVDELWERHQRARVAILTALADLREAHRRHDDPIGEFGRTAATIRRWIETQTFSPRRGSGGVRFADGQAARYGDYDDVFLVGLVEPDWPGGRAPNIFYPSSLLNPLGWPAEQARLAGTRAAFRDLTGLARRNLRLSAFTLEEDALVERSSLLEEMTELAPPATDGPVPARPRIFLDEALVLDPVRDDVLPSSAASWLTTRRGRSPASDLQFHGWAGAYVPDVYSASAVDLYLECPFKFFATYVLRIQEEPEDEEGLTARGRGEFVHDVLRRFYAEWHAGGAGAVTSENLAVAMRLFADVAGRALVTLPASDAALERLRLLGSPVAPGAGDIVLHAEATRPLNVTGRLLELAFDGSFEIEGRQGTRRVRIRGKADRVDLVAGGSFRIVDYKSGRAPEWRRSIQLPIYAVCIAQWLGDHHGGHWTVAEAAYLALAGQDNVHVLVPDSKGTDNALVVGQQRFLDAVDGMARGEFPPRPVETFLCSYCRFSAVCRKDYVADE
jgi:RecB family exonuclease